MERNITNILLEGFDALTHEEQQKFLKVAAASAKESTPAAAQSNEKKVPGALSDAELDAVVNSFNI